jgi:hypothetical protein
LSKTYTTTHNICTQYSRLKAMRIQTHGMHEAKRSITLTTIAQQSELKVPMAAWQTDAISVQPDQ